MIGMAQPGTSARWILLYVALAGCTQVTTVSPAAGSNAQREDAGSAPGGECQVASDCVLVYRGCCGSCLPAPREDLLAVPKSKQAEAQRAQCPNPTTCGACYVADPAPLASLMAADCVANRCELVDLRASEISSCKTDSDCVAVGRGCCQPDSGDPAEYVGIHAGADTKILECFPIPPCVPPQPHATPIAFCAADGHCPCAGTRR